jgi:bifunctional DNA-binding transcriptional regulator/antitoxin component of YhaV-PrlF toxin-antitoxin module
MPADIRRKANVHPGTRFAWEVDEAGNILLKPLRLGLDDVAGMFKVDHPLTDEALRMFCSPMPPATPVSRIR